MAELVEAMPGAVGRQESQRLRLAQRLKAALRAWPLHQRFFAALIIFYLAKQILFALIFPPFTGHDEVAHFAYLRTVVEEQRIPVIEKVPTSVSPNGYLDLLPTDLYKYCRYVLQWFCLPDDPRFSETSVRQVTLAGRVYAEGVQYAANHPPLYYMLVAPVYWISEQAGASNETQLYLLRLAAIPFGLAVVVFAYLLTRTLFPTDAFLLVTVPTAVALQTQVSYEATMVNNDIVTIAIYSWVLWLTVLGVRDRFPDRLCAVIGLALGLGVITKTNSITAAGVVGLGMILVLGLSVRSLSQLVKKGLIIAVPVIALATPWFVYMYRTYGNFTALPQIEELQYWNNPAGTFFELLFSWRFVVDRLNETWGQFGWRLIPLDETLLWVIGVPTLAALVGAGIYFVRHYRALLPILPDRADERAQSANAEIVGTVERPARWQAVGVLLMLVACVIAYIAIVQFGTQFALTQARYFFPVINAATLIVMLGFRTLIPAAFRPAGRGVIIMGLVVLNAYIFTSYVVPFWYL